MSVIGSNVLAGASGQSAGGGGGGGGAAISRSLRFNASDSAYLSRTPSSAGNRKTWTWSGWVKRSDLAEEGFFGAGSNGNQIFFAGFGGTDNKFYIHNGVHGVSTESWAVTTAVYRDISAWYHVVLSVDTTQSTASNRVKLYINGVQQDLNNYSGVGFYPSLNYETAVNNNVVHNLGFSHTNSSTVYFDGYLADVHFIDGQALAATDFGETNTNNLWVPKAYAGTYGPPVDQSRTWSSDVTGTADSGYPVTNGFDNNLTTKTGGNLTFTPPSPIACTKVRITMTVYAAPANTIYLNGVDIASQIPVSGSNYFGVPVEFTPSNNQFVSYQCGAGGNEPGWFNKIELLINGNYVALLDPGASVTSNGFHLDFADNSSNAALGTDTSGLSPANNWTVNNLAASALGLATANQGMDVVTYTGNGGTQSISSLAFQPDFLWIKRRDTSYHNYLWDSIRGITKELHTDLDYGEGTATNKLASFDSDGFTIKNQDGVNGNGFTYVAWAWKAGGTASSNTDGTITSSVSVNNTYGFSIVSYTGASGNQSFGHGLGVKPKFIAIKNRSNSANWFAMFDTGAASYQYGHLNTADAFAAASAQPVSNTTVTLGNNNSWFGAAGDNYVAYCWSEVAGFSKFGSYSSDGSTQTIDCGFKPAYVLIKSSSLSYDWLVYDNKRGNANLRPNSSSAEGTQSANTVNFSANGFSVPYDASGSINGTSGSTYVFAAFASKPSGEGIDSLVDTPTNGDTASDTGAGGEITGNYATWNPLSNGGVDLSNGNLDVSNGAAHEAVRSTIKLPATGKYYVEFTQLTFGTSTVAAFGIDYSNATTPPNWSAADKIYLGINPSTIYIRRSGTALQIPSGTPAASGNVMQVAYDADSKKLWLGLDNTWYDSSAGTTGNPSSGANPTESNLEPGFLLCNVHDATGSLNAGQRAFSFAAPTGFKSLNTANLPTPTIADSSQYFDTKLFTGTGSTLALTMANSELSPDFVWIKNRNSTYQHLLFDAVRGATKYLKSDATSAEATNGSTLASFDSNGFTLGGDNEINRSSYTYAAWAWDAGTSTVSNTDGSITSQVRASQTAGFSICSYTGTGANATFGHGLNAAPEMVIIKQRNGTGFWVVGHKDLPFTSDYYMSLNTSDQVSTGAGGAAWQSTAPTSSVVSIGSSGVLNGSGNTHIAYCFAPVAGYSAVGSYTGNGSSSDGPFIFTGFKVAFLMVKIRSGGSNNWTITDNKREGYNSSNSKLFPNTSGAENTGSDFDLLSNGFRCVTSHSMTNWSGRDFIYFAFASHPFASNGGLAR